MKDSNGRFDHDELALGSDKQSETVTFRLGGELLSALKERAELHGVSSHKYARMLVVESLLQGGPGPDVSAILEEIQKQTTSTENGCRKLRDDIAFSMKIIHMTIGGLSERDAQEWVDRNFNR